MQYNIINEPTCTVRDRSVNESVSLYSVKRIIYCTTTNKLYNEMRTMIKPTAETRRFLMRRARGKTENKDNIFYISCETGEIAGSVYLQGDGDWASHIPENTYEVKVSYEPFLSYAQLDEYIEHGIQMNEVVY